MFFKKLFKIETPSDAINTVGDVVKKVADVFDDRKFTDEEKSRHIEATQGYLLELNRIAIQQGTAGAVTRRIIAVLFSFIFVSILTTCIVLLFLEKKEVIHDIVEVAQAFNIGYIMLAIVGFYFGVGVLNSFKTKK